MRRWLLGVLCLITACSRPIGRDAGLPEDGGVPVVDSGAPSDAGAGVDAGPPPPGASVPAPPSEVVSTGSSGLLLRGVVLSPSGPLDPGEVFIEGGIIRCVAADCSGTSGASSATVIETNAVISPGLIDGHNHLTYDFLPEWEAGMTFDNRYTWADVTAYEDHVAPYADGRSSNDRICPAAKWGELRSIVHGTTTVQGQTFNRSCLDRLARNADHYHHLGYDHMRTSIGSVRDITDSDAESLVASFTDPSSPTTRFAVHMQEGVSGGTLLDEFESFAGRDSRTNRHMGISLLAADGQYAGTGLLIHSMSLTPSQIDEVEDTGASVIWSPSSNLVLYGQTAPIADLLGRDITLGLGPDWTPSGEDEMLSEMRVALEYGTAEGITALTPERIWRMATEGSADAVGLSALGRLREGAPADVVVFGRNAADPYRAVIESQARDVRLVLIDGAAYFGEMNLEVATAVNGDCDVLDACGVAKFLCVANTPGSTSDTARAGETLGEIRSQLTDLLGMYGRASELLELAICE